LQTEKVQNQSQSLFQPRQSNANRIWIFTVLVVLTVLFFETRTKSSTAANFCISSNSEATGAEVFIDDTKVGTLAKEGAGGLGGSAFRGLLMPGHHKIEIKKPNSKTFSRDIEMKKELYLEVALDSAAR
jgi:hypothetical protein